MSAEEAAERALWYRDRAEEIRAVATSMPQGMARRGMLELAQSYDAMAVGLALGAGEDQAPAAAHRA